MSEQKQYYRVLGRTDIIEWQDLYVNGPHRFSVTTHMVGRTVEHFEHCILRPSEPAGWPEPYSFWRVGGPDSTKPVLLFSQVTGLWTGWATIKHTNSTQYSHWLPMPPKPPAPARDDWEVALEAHIARECNGTPLPIETAAFKAGYLAASSARKESNAT